MNATVPENTAWYNRHHRPGGAVSPYPVCEMRWGSTNTYGLPSLTILDMAALSHYAYASSTHTDLLHEYTRASFKRDVEVVYVNDFSEIPRLVATRFPPEESGQNGTVVLAVKGTTDVREIFTDAGFWTGIAVMQVVNFMAPVLNNLPSSFIAKMLDVFQIPSAKQTQSGIINRIQEKLVELQALYPADDIVLTGHSMGGGLAEIVSAQMGMPAVVFSGLGNEYSREKFDYTMRGIYRNVVGVIPDSDRVPRVDQHVDMSQHIQCVGPDGFPRNPLACHAVFTSACELWRVCGDVKLRDWRGLCLEDKNPSGRPVVNKNCLGQRFGYGDCP